MAWEPLGVDADQDVKKAYVLEVQSAAIKARSIIRETIDSDDVGLVTEPWLFRPDDMNLITMTYAMLEGDREITPSDIVNLNFIVGQSMSTALQIGVRQVQRNA